MSNLQFDEGENLSGNIKSSTRYQIGRASQRGMEGFLLRKGLAKNEDLAKIILICVAIFFFAMSGLVWIIL